MKRTQLLTKIRDAFQSVEYPKDDNIIVNIDKYRESYDMWLEFKGKHWEDIPLKVLEDYRMSVGRFTPDGFHYYLPAFLLAALGSKPIELDSYLVLNFVPPEAASEKKKFDEKMDLLTRKQKDVVLKFLLKFIRDNPILFADKYEQVLEYWKSE